MNAASLMTQTVPATRVYSPNIIEIQYAQPVDVEGYPSGPVYWLCRETGGAGRLFLDVRATPRQIARNLHRSMRAPFDHVEAHMKANGLLPDGLLYDWRARDLAEDMEGAL
jgi:hypothetical protein